MVRRRSCWIPNSRCSGSLGLDIVCEAANADTLHRVMDHIKEVPNSVSSTAGALLLLQLSVFYPSLSLL